MVTFTSLFSSLGKYAMPPGSSPVKLTWFYGVKNDRVTQSI